MRKFLLPTLTIGVLLIGFLLGNALSNKVNAQRIVIRNGQVMFQSENKISHLLMLLEQAYVDPVNVDSLTEEAMADVVQKLDPHSSYIPKKDLEMINSELSSSFSGIGVQFNIQDDTVRVVAVIAGGPSAGVGVLAGDAIVEVNDTSFTGKKMSNERVMHTLRGEKGSEVKLGILRSGEEEILHFTVVRGDIPTHSVDAKFIIPGRTSDQKIGFVRVNKFGEDTYNEFINALNYLRNLGATSYIVDLRENSGGYMQEAVKMANEFLERGDMIVYAEGRAYPRFEYKANGSGRFKNAKLVVLIDGFSASASEIFSGAMQDNDRATIIGRRSFGKGLVQNQMEFEDGSAVRLTIARYYIPSGRCIQKPYKMGEKEDYEKDFLERYEKGEFFSADNIHYADTTLYYTKNGRVVHGGGGIMPDIFVGRDTTLYTKYFNRVANRAYTYQFAFQYTNRHRKQLERYKDWQSLERHLLQLDLLSDFVQFCEMKGIEPQWDEIHTSAPLIRRLVNAYIVRDVLGDEGFFPLFERDDEITKRAVMYLSD